MLTVNHGMEEGTLGHSSKFLKAGHLLHLRNKDLTKWTIELITINKLQQKVGHYMQPERPEAMAKSR